MGFLGLVFCGLTSGATLAVTNTNDIVNLPESVTLDYCIARSMAAAERKGVFDSEVALARADVTAARARSTPHLNVIPDARYYPDNSDVQGAISADLGEHFLEIPQNRLQRRIARRNVTRARARQGSLRITRRADVIRAYVDCLKTEKELELSEMEGAARETEDAAWGRIDVRSTALVEQREAARLALQNARAQMDQAQLRQGETRRQLSELCDFPVGIPFRMEELPDFEMPSAGLEDCQAWARTNHSDVLTALYEIDTTELMVKLARMGRLPTPGLSFGYTDRGRDEFDNTDRGAYGAIHLRIPLWDAGETRANVERLQARRESLIAEMQRLQSDLEKNITAAFLAMKEAFIALESARSDPNPERRFRAAEIRFKNGELSTIGFEAERISWARHQALLRMKNGDCYRAQAKLLEAVEATREPSTVGLGQDRSSAEKE